MIQKRWTQEEENLLIKLRESGYTYKQISIEIGRSAASCKKKYYRLVNPKYIEKEKKYYQNNKDQIAEYHKQYYQNNKDQIVEYQKEYKKEYYEKNKNQIAEQQKQYYQNNRDQITKQQKQYKEKNKDQIAEYQKKYQKEYRENNREYLRQYSRNYHAQNPHKTTRKERYDGEFADIQLCHDFYNHTCPITGMKDDLQVHHLISIRDNYEFWQSATEEEKINNLILIPKDLHMSYHTWLGGTKVESSPESFWEFIDTIYFNEE